MRLRITAAAFVILGAGAAAAQTIDTFPTRLWFPDEAATVSTQSACTAEAPCPAAPQE